MTRRLARTTGIAYTYAAAILIGYLAAQRARRMDATRFARAMEEWLNTGLASANLGTDD